MVGATIPGFKVGRFPEDAVDFAVWAKEYDEKISLKQAKQASQANDNQGVIQESEEVIEEKIE